MAYTMAGLETVEKTVQKTHEWVKDVAEEMETDDRHFAFQALRAALHVLRDRLPVQEAANLGDQLPMLIRGLYYEGWNPSRAPIKDRRAEDFLERLWDYFPKESALNTEKMARSVFRVMRRRVSDGEMGDVGANLPESIRALLK
jgi:uncharacterized protein (DUF2267 family)